MKEILQCKNCGHLFEEYGDDYWLECPFCQSDKWDNIQIRLFEEGNLEAAAAYAEQGGIGLHLFGFAAAIPGAPICFKRTNQAGHLIDRNLQRLKELAALLGVRKIVIGREGQPKQHVDLCGRPLRRAIELCNLISVKKSEVKK